jgi:ABC-type multidrug transport system fused ATPase/permease subunit
MKSGRILDSGKHSELLERCDYYKDLIKNQIVDKNAELKKI